MEHVQNKEPDLCDDTIKCECGGFAPNRPEWKHQIRWAIVDLKYSEKITYSKKTKLYSLRQKLIFKRIYKIYKIFV